MSERRLHKLLLPLAAIAVLAAVWLVLQRFPSLLPGAAPATPEQAGDAGPGRTAASAQELYYGPPNSVAVLPFADRSVPQDQQAQAYGFAWDLVTRLQQLRQVQVAAQSSAFFFGDGSVPLRIVAERLQSRFVMTGEWRSGGGEFGVVAALYDARRDREVWRRELNGALPDVLEVRDELALALMQTLPAVSPPDWTSAATVDSDAWALLQAGRRLADPTGSADPAAAADSIRLALERQPDFDAARLALAELWLHPAWSRLPGQPGVEEARAAVLEVLDRAPSASAADRAFAWGLLSYIRHHHDWQWQPAAEAAAQAVALSPGDAGLLALASLAHFTLGEFEPARELLQASLRRDPLNLGSRLRLGLAQEFSGLYEDALATYRQVLSLRPDYPGAHAYRARVKVLQGKAESALRESEQEADPFWRGYAELLALVAADRRAEADPRLERLMAEHGNVAAFQLAEILAYEGETGPAFEWLERARLQRDPGLSSTLGNPLLEALHGDPRWADLLERLGLPADPAEHR